MCPSAVALVMVHKKASKTKRTERGVRFSNSPPTVHLVEQVEGEVHSKLWYTKTEVKLLREETRATIRTCRDGKNYGRFPDSGLDSPRGLEMFISTPLRNEFHREQETLYEFVFAEQTLQNLKGTKNPSAIEEVSAMCSKWARKRALATAAINAFEVTRDEDSPKSGGKRKRPYTHSNKADYEVSTCAHGQSKKKTKVRFKRLD